SRVVTRVRRDEAGGQRVRALGQAARGERGGAVGHGHGGAQVLAAVEELHLARGARRGDRRAQGDRRELLDRAARVDDQRGGGRGGRRGVHHEGGGRRGGALDTRGRAGEDRGDRVGARGQRRRGQGG